jgi:hypothetical protein
VFSFGVWFGGAWGTGKGGGGKLEASEEVKGVGGTRGMAGMKQINSCIYSDERDSFKTSYSTDGVMLPLSGALMGKFTARYLTVHFHLIILKTSGSRIIYIFNGAVSAL